MSQTPVTSITPSSMTRHLRKIGIAVGVKGKTDHMNGGISYTHSGEITANGFAADLRLAGFQVDTFRARVTITALPA